MMTVATATAEAAVLNELYTLRYEYMICSNKYIAVLNELSTLRNEHANELSTLRNEYASCAKQLIPLYRCLALYMRETEISGFEPSEELKSLHQAVRDTRFARFAAFNSEEAVPLPELRRSKRKLDN